MPNAISLLREAFSNFENDLLPQQVYETAIREAKKISNADAGSIFFHTGDTFQRVYSCVPKDRQGVPSPHGLAYKAMYTHKPYIHTNRSVAHKHPELYKTGVKSIIVIPLVHEDDMLGILALQTYSSKKVRKNLLPILQTFGTVTSQNIYKTQKLDEIQNALRTRNLFMSVASHELKNPITTIRMYSQLISDAIEKKTIPPKKWTDILANEITQLVELINDLLTKEKFSLYDMDYEWKQDNIKQVLSDTIEKYQTTHPHRQIIYKDLTEEKVILIRIDSHKMQQVLNNILNNAVKFSPASQPITVTISTIPKYIVIQIIDKGKGISTINEHRLFEKFYKGDPRKEGMGLGLYVAKTIIDKHKGKIKLSSRVQQGTTVQITLPRK